MKMTTAQKWENYWLQPSSYSDRLIDKGITKMFAESTLRYTDDDSCYLLFADGSIYDDVNFDAITAEDAMHLPPHVVKGLTYTAEMAEKIENERWEQVMEDYTATAKGGQKNI